MDVFDPTQHSHRRRNPLTGEWLIVSPHRAQRPWQGRVEARTPETRPAHDPTCFLCPGNVRANGVHNPDYTNTFVFDNDFAALLPTVPEPLPYDDDLFGIQAERGLCRVLCFSPRHDLTLAQLDQPALEAVIATWVAQARELSTLPSIQYVQIFENKGALMGCSNPHPHGQLWANTHLPTEPAKELLGQRAYFARHNTCLLCAYLAREHTLGERLVCTNAHFTALVPFWAIWPFETLVLPHRHSTTLDALTPAEHVSLALILKELTVRYDNLFETSFPYSMGFHPQPCDGADYPEWHLHQHFYPPLLRSAEVKKFMVGYEMLASPQRDLTPEQAAARLRAVPDVRYA